MRQGQNVLSNRAQQPDAREPAVLRMRPLSARRWALR